MCFRRLGFYSTEAEMDDSSLIGKGFEEPSAIKSVCPSSTICVSYNRGLRMENQVHLLCSHPRFIFDLSLRFKLMRLLNENNAAPQSTWGVLYDYANMRNNLVHHYSPGGSIVDENAHMVMTILNPT